MFRRRLKTSAEYGSSPKMDTRLVTGRVGPPILLTCPILLTFVSEERQWEVCQWSRRGGWGSIKLPSSCLSSPEETLLQIYTSGELYLHIGHVCAKYYEQLYVNKPPTGEFQIVGLQTLDADPPIDETAPSLHEERKAIGRLRGGKMFVICKIQRGAAKGRGWSQDPWVPCWLDCRLAFWGHSSWLENGVGNPYPEFERVMSGLRQLPWDYVA